MFNFFEQDSDVLVSSSLLKKVSEQEDSYRMGDMEKASTDPTELTQQTTKQKQKGGLRTMPFIIANEAFERVASFALVPNMIIYLIKEYNMALATGNSVLSVWSAATNFLPIAGGFLSDSYLGRYRTIILGSLASLLGMILLWLTTMIRQAQPPNCIQSSPGCKSATSRQLALLFSSFVFMSIGAGGIRPCALAFGADQLDKEENPNNKRLVQSYFNWYYAATGAATMIAMTVLVYVQDHLGWKIGFGIPAIVMFLSATSFVLASSLYIRAKPNKSMFNGFILVPVAAFRNRHIALPPRNKEGCYHHLYGSNMVVPTDKLRFLNRACVIKDREKDLNADGTALNPWRLCTVQQVEEIKALIKVIPLWSTGIVMSVNISQMTFPVLQATSMDRHLTQNFQIPAASFGIFTMLTLTIWVGIYDRLILPQLAKLTGKPYGIGLKQRMGIGLVLAIMGMALSAIVESIRRRTAINQGLADNPQGIVNMSAMWLVPQYSLNGLAEAFNAIGQTEFYYSQFPKSMSSIATSLYLLGMAFGSLLVGFVVEIVDDVTKKGGKESWVSSNLNRAHYDYYYWILAILGGINFLYFLGCCWAYGPCEGERTRTVDDNEGMKEEERAMQVQGKAND